MQARWEDSVIIAHLPIRLTALVGVFILVGAAWFGSLNTAARDMSQTGQHGNHAHEDDATPASTDSPYADTYDTGASIRTLRSDEVEQIRRGEGAGFALPAELNGVPGPRHVLGFAAELGLSPDQEAQVQDVYDRYLSEAIPAGERYLAAVQALEEGFRAGTITEEALPGRVAEVSRLEGELVTIHLIAHLQTAEILMPAQIATYNQLRGYE
jgi:Spy/CpxP family protein refolding chaperone